MSEQLQESTALLEQFRGHLSTKRYSSGIIKRYSVVAEHFLLFLEQKRVQVTSAQPQDIAMYLKRELKLFHQQHPDGHFKFPHLWPVKFPQAGRLNYRLFGLPGSGFLSW